MVIQVLPALERRPSTGQRLGQAFGEAIMAGGEAYQKHQKKKQLEEAFQNIESQYSGNPEQQKLAQAYRQLAGTGRPDLAKELVGPLSRLGAQQQKSFVEKLKVEERQNQMTQSIQKLQGLYNDPNLSEEQKIFGVYQELNQNPTLANNLLGSLQKPGKARGEDIAGQQFSAGYNAIQEGDNKILKDILESSDTPLAVKKQLTNLHDKYETRKSVQARELRGRQSLVQKSYKQAIEGEKKKLETYSSKEEEARLRKNIKHLEALQRQDLKRLAKNPDAYTTLSLWNAVDPDYLPEEEEEGLEGAELAGERGLGGENAEFGGMEFAENKAMPVKQEQRQPPEIQERVEFLNSKFPAQQFKGKMKKDKSGRIYVPDGQTWRLAQE